MPPALQHVKLEFDHDGHLTTAGLSVCRPSQLEGATTAQARRPLRRRRSSAPGSSAPRSAWPGLARIDLRAPLTLFNGPRRDGNPTAILHAQAPFPVSETYVIVDPDRTSSRPLRLPGRLRHPADRRRPRLAHRTSARRSAASTAPTASQHSYISARCSDYILQTQGYFSFADGNVIYGSVFKSAGPRAERPAPGQLPIIADPGPLAQLVRAGAS